VERGDFAASVRELYPAGVDAAIDVVGREVGRNAMASVRDGGALASIFTDYAGTGAESLTAERGIRLQNPLTVQPDTAELGRLLDAAGRGELRTEVAHTYPLARAADAHRRQSQGGLGGRLILVP
jgi:NADPH2:quinone reductase